MRTSLKCIRYWSASFDSWRHSKFFMPERSFGCIMLWHILSVQHKQSLVRSLTLNLYSPRLTFLSIIDGHDPKLIPIDFGVGRSKVRVTVT